MLPQRVEHSSGKICWLPHMLKCNSCSQELSTPGSRYCICRKIYVIKSYTYTENDNSSGVKCLTDVKSTRFRSKLDSSCGFSYTE